MSDSDSPSHRRRYSSTKQSRSHHREHSRDRKRQRSQSSSPDRRESYKRRAHSPRNDHHARSDHDRNGHRDRARRHRDDESEQDDSGHGRRRRDRSKDADDRPRRQRPRSRSRDATTEHRRDDERALSHREKEKSRISGKDRHRDRDEERGREDRHRHKDKRRHERHSRSNSRSPPRRKHRRSSRSRSPIPATARRSRGPLPSQQEAFVSKRDSALGNAAAPLEKQKPNYSASGKLAAETNTVSIGGETIVLKYHEPAEARKPPASHAWRMYEFKGENADPISTTELGLRSCWLFGRETAVVDFLIEHPSCSKQHAVIQFRYVEKRNEFGDKIGAVKPYILDLESANGTVVNGERIPDKRYIEIKSGDSIGFGESTREYVVLLPPRDKNAATE